MLLNKFIYLSFLISDNPVGQKYLINAMRTTPFMQFCYFLFGIFIGLGISRMFLDTNSRDARATTSMSQTKIIIKYVPVNDTKSGNLIIPPMPNECFTNHAYHTIGSIDFKGRLGNLMFQYAAMYAVGRRRNFVPILHGEMELYRIFNGITAVKIDSINRLRMKTFTEKKAAVYDTRVETLDPNADWLISGFFQSWKYFYWIKDEIRKEFRIQGGLLAEAQTFLRSVSSKEHKTFIGVHIRRGDMLTKSHQKVGYNVVPVDYLKHAFTYYRKRYLDAIFVVCSDDIKWAQDNLKNEANVHFSVGKNQYVDFAILSSCNHTIQTVGSFGWWAAFIAGGENVYYAQPIREGSELSSSYNLKDFFLPEWHGMM